MAISEKSRSALYQGLVSIAGEEAVGEMLSYFPARDLDEPVSKEFLRAEIADMRTEIEVVKVTMADVKTDIHRSLNRLFVALSGTMIGVVGVATTVIISTLR